MDFSQNDHWKLSMFRLKLIKLGNKGQGAYAKVLDAPTYKAEETLTRGGIQEHRKNSVVGSQIAYEFKYEHLNENAYQLFENWAHQMELDQKLIVKLVLKPKTNIYEASEAYVADEGEMEKDLRKEAERVFVQEEGGQIIRVKLAYENTTSAFREFLKHHYNVECS